MSYNNFRKDLKSGQDYEKEFSELLRKSNVQHKVVDSTVSNYRKVQEFGDIYLSNPKTKAFLELKNVINYDANEGDRELSNIYFELGEIYGSSFSKKDYRENIRLVGFSKNLFTIDKHLTIYVMKLGQSGLTLVSNPVSLFNYFSSSESFFKKDVIVSRADTRGKRKAGLRMRGVFPELVKESWGESEASNYIDACNSNKDVLRAIKKHLEISERSWGMNPTDTFKTLVEENFWNRNKLAYENWWNYEVMTTV